eukprot:6175-Heterococcus_DN1.PRE.2
MVVLLRSSSERAVSACSTACASSHDCSELINDASQQNSPTMRPAIAGAYRSCSSLCNTVQCTA